jgi:hypothetical protein
VKTLYRGAIVLWLVSGAGLHAYFARAAQGAAGVAERRHAGSRPLEPDARARRILPAPGPFNARATEAFAGWVFVGVLLAIPGVRALFRGADGVRETERFLAGALVLFMALPGGGRRPWEPVESVAIGPYEKTPAQAPGFDSIGDLGSSCDRGAGLISASGSCRMSRLPGHPSSR